MKYGKEKSRMHRLIQQKTDDNKICYQYLLYMPGKNQNRWAMQPNKKDTYTLVLK